LALNNNHLLTNFIIRARIGGSGTAMHSFERKGIVEIELDEEDSTNHDDHIEMALEAEAKIYLQHLYKNINHISMLISVITQSVCLFV
jgi:transcriptional/translational regulatory protein YebC/TACO1